MKMNMKMLVGFDSSEESYRAFDLALGMAASYQFPAIPEINVLSVIQRPGIGLDVVDIRSLVDDATAEFKALFKTLEEKAKAANLRIRTEIAVGHPAKTIVQAAKDKGCQLIIVGHRRRSKLSRLVLGSVSKHVASRAHCSVVLVEKGLEPVLGLWDPGRVAVSPA